MLVQMRKHLSLFSLHGYVHRAQAREAHGALSKQGGLASLVHLARSHHALSACSSCRSAFAWWSSRNDVDAGRAVKLYYYEGIMGKRWRLEGPVYSFWAPDDVISNDDNLVRVWRFSNADQSWNFYDPRPAFASANTLAKTGAGDIVWVNVTAEQTFQSATLFPGWNLISLN